MQFHGFDWLSGHEPLYHAREQGPLNCLLVVLAKLNHQDLAIFLDCF